jgi:flagellar hook-associated protein 2
VAGTASISGLGTASISGLGSSTDWASLITDMIDAQKAATINPYTTSKTNYETKLAAWQAFNLTLTTVVDYIDNSSLDEDDGYALYASSLYSSDASVTASEVLSVSLGDVTGPGRYSIEVTNLAEAEKISSDAFASQTSALSISGDLVINNKKVSITATDTLVDVAGRINDAGAGVTATVLKVSDTEYRLMLESDATGAEGMSLKNGSTTDVLESLKLHTTSVQLAHSSGADALSDTYTSKTSAIGSLLGLTAAESGTIKIKGTDVTIDLSTATLESISTAINTAAPPGVTSSVEEVTVNGATQYRLKLTGVVAGDFQEDKNILETLGILEGVRENLIRAGEDATVEIDGYGLTSSSNTITDAIQGVTLNLTGTNDEKPIDLIIAQSSSQISQKFSGLVSNVNSILSYVKEQNNYTSDSTSSSTAKPLMGDVHLVTARNSIVSAIYENVAGNTQFTNASSVGIGFGSDGTLSVNESTLTNALSTNRQETINVLKALGDNLREKLNGYVDPYTGTLTYVKTSIEGNISRIDERIEELNEKFERQREMLERRFNALEVLITQSNLTKNWLTQQVNYMTGSSE